MHELASSVDSGGMTVGLTNIDSKKQLRLHRVPSLTHCDTSQGHRGSCVQIHVTQAHNNQSLLLLAFRTNQTGSRDTPELCDGQPSNQVGRVGRVSTGIPCDERSCLL